MSRFTRQIRLAEVGEAGQAKLSSAHVTLRTDGFARVVEKLYLDGAGVGVKASSSGAETSVRRETSGGGVGDGQDMPEFRGPNAGEGSCDQGQNPGMGGSVRGRSISGAEAAARGLGLRHAAARDVAEGALAALVAMREVLA